MTCNIYHLDSYRPVTELTEARLNAALDWKKWTPPEAGMKEEKYIEAVTIQQAIALDTIKTALVAAKTALHAQENANLPTADMTVIVLALEDASDKAHDATQAHVNNNVTA